MLKKQSHMSHQTDSFEIHLTADNETNFLVIDTDPRTDETSILEQRQEASNTPYLSTLNTPCYILL